MDRCDESGDLPFLFIREAGLMQPLASVILYKVTQNYIQWDVLENMSDCDLNLFFLIPSYY